VLCGERCLCGGRAAAAGRLAGLLVRRRSGNGSALYERALGRCCSHLTWCFVVDEFTCSRALVWCWDVLWFGASLRAGTCLVKASGRLAGMRGLATRLKRDVRPVLGVMSDGRRVCVRDGGSVCYRENIVWCRRCMSEEQRKANPQDSTVSQQKSPPPDSLVAFKGRCPAAAAASLHLLLPRGVSAVKVPPSRLPCPLIGCALIAVLPQEHVYKASILHITSCSLARM
jgi:hypothetical protein